jgi:hypothetical protein
MPGAFQQGKSCLMWIYLGENHCGLRNVIATTFLALGDKTGVARVTLKKGSQGKYSKCHCHHRLHFCKKNKT